MKLEKLKSENKSLSKESMNITFGGRQPDVRSGNVISGFPNSEDLITD